MNRVSPMVTAGFAAFVVAMLVAGWIVVQALSPSVTGTQREHTAMFTDVSGLVVGNDVRELGVRVGRVESIKLADNGTEAQVSFSVRDSSPIHANTKIAIRYLNLVGQRYLDLQTDGAPHGKVAATEVIPVERTIGSFDVTEMFNGLRPLFSSLRPDELNSLMTNVLAVVEGRGGDVGSVLKQLQRLSTTVSDRSALIGTVLTQLGRVAGEIRYKSPKLNELIDRVATAFGVVAAQADELQRSMVKAARSLKPVRLLLEALEDSYYGNYADVDRLLRKWIPQVNSATDLLARVPGLIGALDNSLQAASRPRFTCAAGEATQTPMTRILLAGVPVVVCR